MSDSCRGPPGSSSFNDDCAGPQHTCMPVSSAAQVSHCLRIPASGGPARPSLRADPIEWGARGLNVNKEDVRGEVARRTQCGIRASDTRGAGGGTGRSSFSLSSACLSSTRGCTQVKRTCRRPTLGEPGRAPVQHRRVPSDELTCSTSARYRLWTRCDCQASATGASTRAAHFPNRQRTRGLEWKRRSVALPY
jgi:hypothetical protein